MVIEMNMAYSIVATLLVAVLTLRVAVLRLLVVVPATVGPLPRT